MICVDDANIAEVAVLQRELPRLVVPAIELPDLACGALLHCNGPSGCRRLLRICLLVRNVWLKGAAFFLFIDCVFYWCFLIILIKSSSVQERWRVAGITQGRMKEAEEVEEDGEDQHSCKDIIAFAIQPRYLAVEKLNVEANVHTKNDEYEVLRPDVYHGLLALPVAAAE